MVFRKTPRIWSEKIETLDFSEIGLRVAACQMSLRKETVESGPLEREFPKDSVSKNRWTDHPCPGSLGFCSLGFCSLGFCSLGLSSLGLSFLSLSFLSLSDCWPVVVEP